MEALTYWQGIVMPLNRANVNTDAIIPAEYLKVVTRTGFADALFSYWRYRKTDGLPDPTFELNMPRYQKASILLTRENFGCGSSREHAPWALYEYGFRIILSPGFADIFYNNCFNTGILPIVLDADVIDQLFQAVESTEGYTLTVDVAEQTVSLPNGETIAFTLDAARKERLMSGMDAIDYTLQYQDTIINYEQHRLQEAPWCIS